MSPMDSSKGNTAKCPHGFEIGVSRIPVGTVMAAPWSFCECCKTDFFYIDRGSYTQHRTVTETNDKKLCRACGGKVTRTVIEDGRLTSEVVS